MEVERDNSHPAPEHDLTPFIHSHASLIFFSDLISHPFPFLSLSFCIFPLCFWLNAARSVHLQLYRLPTTTTTSPHAHQPTHIHSPYMRDGADPSPMTSPSKFFQRVCSLFSFPSAIKKKKAISFCFLLYTCFLFVCFFGLFLSSCVFVLSYIFVFIIVFLQAHFFFGGFFSFVFVFSPSEAPRLLLLYAVS
jgi:hypothetical protein